MSAPVDWQDTLRRLTALHDQLQEVFNTGTYVGSLGTTTSSILDTTYQGIAYLAAQGANFGSGWYSPFGSESEAWQAWIDSANATAADLNRALGLNAAWDVTRVVPQVLADTAANVKAAAAGIGAGIVLLLVLVLAVELAR